MRNGTVGREAELRAIDGLLDGVGGGPAALVLSGEAGIGKTTVFEAGVAAADDRGFTVLCSRPTSTEVRLSYAGLADLLAGIDDFDDLPAPQRRALDAALLRGAAVDDGPDPRPGAAGFLSVLDRLARTGPVLVAIDDLQWLDHPTRHVVQFAAQRCRGPIAMLFAERVDDADGNLADIGPVDTSRCTRVKVGPLSVAALHHVLKDRAGRVLPRHVLVKVAELSAGNPFYAIELVRSLDAKPTGFDSMPGSLRAAMGARLDALAPATIDALRVVSGLANPRLARIEQALGTGAVDALGPAEDAGVVRITGATARFTHPLLATAIYSEMRPTARRQLHRRLSAVVDDVEERARHLALASVGGDARTWAALDEAAAHARRRGAPGAAAELLEQAIGLGGRDPERLVQAAEDHYHAGNLFRAGKLLTRAIGDLGRGVLRARALARLGFLRFLLDASPEAVSMFEQAVDESADDPRLRASTATELCWVLYRSGRASESRRYAELAVDDAVRLGDPGLLAEALAMRTFVRYLLGDGLDSDALARALATEDVDRTSPVQVHPSDVASRLHAWTHRYRDAFAASMTVRRRSIERGAESDLWYVDVATIPTACAVGELATTEQLVDGLVDRLRDAGTTQARAVTDIARAQRWAWIGRIDDARTAAEAVLGLDGRGVAAMLTAEVSATLGTAELAAGNLDAAAKHSLRAVQTSLAAGHGEPATISGMPDAIEALVLVDRLDDARELVSWVEERVTGPGSGWAQALAARGRALLLAAAGEVDAAASEFEQALAAHELIPEERFERARTLLLAGQAERRRNRRRAAHALLSEAGAEFDRIGAAPWAANARTALRRLGLQPGPADHLTATERRIAELASSGLTNRQVASALVVSPKTVEAHLSRVYRKLGIRRRAELGRYVGNASIASRG